MFVLAFDNAIFPHIGWQIEWLNSFRLVVFWRTQDQINFWYVAQQSEAYQYKLPDSNYDPGNNIRRVRHGVSTDRKAYESTISCDYSAGSWVWNEIDPVTMCNQELMFVKVGQCINAISKVTSHV
jgi:hypothetical protein